ncbi:hypothetical protein CJF31_00011080 [Rutstroemia sp. NJR-2017a BVV2]
MHLRT